MKPRRITELYWFYAADSRLALVVISSAAARMVRLICFAPIRVATESTTGDRRL
jgi:hypothetical protein